MMSKAFESKKRRIMEERKEKDQLDAILTALDASAFDSFDSMRSFIEESAKTLDKSVNDIASQVTTLMQCGVDTNDDMTKALTRINKRNEESLTWAHNPEDVAIENPWLKLGTSLDAIGKARPVDLAKQSHYTECGIEPIDIMKSNFTEEQYRGFLKGNVLKYLMRYERKNGLEDLKKAQVYLGWLIEQEEE